MMNDECRILTLLLLAAPYSAVYNQIGISLRLNSVSNILNFFDDPDEVPRPPDEVRITEVRAEPLPDGRRVAVSISLTPFLEKPDLDVVILRDGHEERTLSVIGAMQHEMQVTMHLPAVNPQGSYTVRVDLLREKGIQQTATAAFQV